MPHSRPLCLALTACETNGTLGNQALSNEESGTGHKMDLNADKPSMSSLDFTPLLRGCMCVYIYIYISYTYFMYV